MKIECAILDDLQLIQYLQRGEKEAFDEIYKRYSKYLFRYAYKRVGLQEDVADLVQDLFVKIWVKREALVVRGSLQAYLTICIRNIIIDKYDHRALKNNYLSSEYSLAEISDSTQQQIDYNDLKQFLNLQINKLPEKMQEVFLLRKVDDLSIDEISERLSLSKQTIKNQLHTAVNRLRISYKNYFLLVMLFVLHFILL